MKRILPAILTAVLLHAFIFTLEPGFLNRKHRDSIKKPAISVTMSYKKKEPPPPVKKPPEKKKVETKVRVPEKAKEPPPVKVKEEVLKPEPLVEEAVEQEPEDIQEYTKETDFEYEGPAERVIEERVSDVITEAIPIYKSNPEPAYPPIARRRRFEGTVLLSVLVNEKGLVDDLWLYESSGYNMLDNAALDAVKDWVFEPGRIGDKVTEMWVQVPVRFELK